MWKPLAWQHALVIFASFECIAKWKLYFDWIPSSKKIIFSFCVLVLLLKSKIKTCGTSTLTPCQALRQVLLQNILKTFPPCSALPAWQRLDLSEVALVGTGRRQAVCCWQACEGRMRATPTFSLFNHVTPSLSLLVQLEQETPPCKSPTTLENLLQKRHLGMIWEAWH